MIPGATALSRHIDIVNVAPEVHRRFMFTDDTTLITKQKNLEAIWIEFFVKINNLAKFFSQNSLNLNLDKTKLMVTKTLQEHNKSLSGAPVIYIGDDELDITKSQNSWGGGR